MIIPHFFGGPMSVQLNQTALRQNLRVVNQLQKEEIEILEKLIEVLPSSEDEVIDEWLDRLERNLLGPGQPAPRIHLDYSGIPA